MSGVPKKYGYLSFHEGDANFNLSILYKEGIKDDDIFIEEFVLGKKREELYELIDSLNTGDEIVTESFQQLGVSFLNVSSIILEIISKGAKVKFIKENLEVSDQENAKNKYLVEIIKIFNGFEKDQKKYLQQIGIKKAKKDGRYSGRHNLLKAKDILRLKEMMKLNITKKSMCKELKVSRPTIYRYIRILQKEKIR